MHTLLHYFARGNKILVWALAVVWCLFISVFASIDRIETPQLLSPENNSHISEQVAINFQWKHDTKAEKYIFYLYNINERKYMQKDTALSADTICSAWVCQVSYSWPMSNGNRYRWYVWSAKTGLASTKVYSNFTFGNHPVLPKPLYPKNSQILSSKSEVYFTWTPSQNATAYDFYIYDRNQKKVVNKKFNTPAINICQNGVCRMELDEDLADARNHVWYVRARNGSLLWSLVSTYFHVSLWAEPVTPQVISPLQGETLSSGENIEYSWKAVAWATSYNFSVYNRVLKKIAERRNGILASDVCSNGTCQITIDTSVLQNSKNHVWYLTSINNSGVSPLAYTVFHVDGVDTEAPKIELLWTKNQQIGYQEAYTELGATATDNIDGDISHKIVIDSSNVDTNIFWKYTVTYTATDSSWNVSQTTREVSVVVATPENLQVDSSSETQITLSWDVLSYAEWYNISKDDSYYTTIKWSNSYIDTDVVPWKIYTYKISAFYDGNYSSNSIDVRAIAATRITGWDTPKDTSHLPAEIAENYSLKFNDEFNGGILDFDKWNTAFIWGPDLTINNEEQYYVDALDTDQNIGMSPFSFSSWSLVITADKTPDDLKSKVNNKTYTSWIITSRDSYNFTYGYAEAKVKVPAWQGLWPAFWLLNTYYVDKKPEIDIMELLGHQPTRAYQTYHYFDTDGKLVSTESHVDGVDYSKNYHIYSVKWEPGIIQFYIDGQPYKTINDVNVADQEMYILANLAVWGNWPKAPDETTQFPAKYAIDWIRVYQK